MNRGMGIDCFSGESRVRRKIRGGKGRTEWESLPARSVSSGCSREVERESGGERRVYRVSIVGV